MPQRKTTRGPFAVLIAFLVGIAVFAACSSTGGLGTISAGAAATSATAIGTAALGPDPSGTLTQMGGYAAGAGANIQSCAP